MTGDGFGGQALASVFAFVVLLACLPAIVRWLQRKARIALPGATGNARLISALAVGPQQRVVTVEVGPDGARSWLVLGVTQQNISCLQTISLDAQGAPRFTDALRAQQNAVAPHDAGAAGAIAAT